MSKYSKEFKTEALKLSDEIGVKKASQQLGLNYYTLSDWRKSRKANPICESEDKKKMRELEKEIAQLKRANEILKEALGFFAQDRKK